MVGIRHRCIAKKAERLSGRYSAGSDWIGMAPRPAWAKQPIANVDRLVVRRIDRRAGPNGTGGSVFAAALFYAMRNVSWLMFPNFGSHYDPRVAGPITALAAGLVTLLGGSQTLTRRALIVSKSAKGLRGARRQANHGSAAFLDRRTTARNRAGTPGLPFAWTCAPLREDAEGGQAAASD